MTTHKPGSLTPINWAHPVVRALGDLRGFWTFQNISRAHEAVLTGTRDGILGGTAAVVLDATQTHGRSVLSLDGTSTAIVTFNTAGIPTWFPALPITVVGRLKANSLSSAVNIFANNYDANFYGGIWCLIQTTGQIGIRFGDAGGLATSNRRDKNSATGVVTAGTWFDFAFTIRGATDMSIYVNGVDIGGTYANTGGAMAYAATRLHRFGAVNGGNNGANMNVDYWAMIAGDVPLSTIQAFQADPFAILEKPSGRRVRSALAALVTPPVVVRQPNSYVVC